MFFASPTTRSGRIQESENLLVPAALPTTGPFSPSDGMGYQHAVAAAAAVRNSELEVHGALLQHLYPTGNDVCSLSPNGLLLPADPNCSSSPPSNSTSSPPKMSALGPPPPPEQHPQFWDQTHSTKRESLEHRFVQCQQHVPLPPSQTLLFHDHCSTEMLGSVAMLAPTMSQQLIADFPMQQQQQQQEVCHGSEPVEDGRCNKDSHVDNQTHQWDIKDVRLPNVTTFEPYDLWPNGSCRRVYSFTSERARRHQSGWAMRNTNNHNPHVLKKSCLGVLVCSSGCYMNGQPVAYRPAICDKARKKQCMRACINPGCEGHLVQRHCKGHGGYPVTHFWRFSNNAVFFQAKGEHDHVRPMLKAFGERETRAPRASAGRANSSALRSDSRSSEPGATDATVLAVSAAAATVTAAAGSGKRGKRRQWPAEEPHEMNILAPMRVVRTSSNFGGKPASATVKGIKERRKRARTLRNGSFGLLREPAKFLSEPGPQSPSLLSARESFLFSNQSAVPALLGFQLPTDTAPSFNSLPEDLNQYHHQYQHTPASSSPSVPTLPLKTEMPSWMSPLSFLPPTAPTPPERHILTLPTFEYPFAEGEISRYMAQHENFSQAPATSPMEYSTSAAAAVTFQQAFRQEPPPQPQYHGGNWMIKTEASSTFENFSDRSFPQWELLQQQQHPQLDDAVDREMTTTANGTDSCSPTKLPQHPGDDGNSFGFFQSAAESSLSTANYTQAQISPYGVDVQSTDASDAGPAQQPALPTPLANFHLRHELEQPFLGMLLSLDQGNRQQQQPIGIPPGQHSSPGLSVDCTDETATSTDVSGAGLPMGESLGSDGEEGDGGSCSLGASQQGYWKGQQPKQEEEVKSLRLPSMEQVSQATCQPVYGDLRTDWFSRSTAWKTVGSS